MALKKVALSLVACGWFFLSAGLGVAKDYKVGTEFSDIFKIDFPAGRKSVPLPPGVWKLVAKPKYLSGGDAFSVPIVRFYLIRHSNNFISGVISIATPVEMVDFYWSISKLCSNKRIRRSWYSDEDSYTRHEDCNIVYPIRGFNRKSKNLKQVFNYIDSRGLTIPNTWVFIRFGRSQDEDMLKVSYGLPPENYGFPRERKYSNTESPWSVNNIDAFPKKKAFMQKAIAWAKSWKGLVDKGFANELRKEEVIAHPKIDGSVARKPAMTTGSLPKPSDPSIEGRLRKLQQLLDKKLISPDEFGEMRRKILDKI